MITNKQFVDSIIHGDFICYAMIDCEGCLIDVDAPVSRLLIYTRRDNRIILFKMIFFP